jgi:glycosyltransferase involved in cell wall biosynthesis
MNKILVLLPFYNYSHLLKASIDSILNQTYQNFKLVLIDDASTDSSLEVAKQYATLPNVEIIENPTNMGPYYCLNLGLLSNRDLDWDWVITHGGDDISYPTRFQNQVDAITNNSIAVSCRFDRVDYHTNRRTQTNPETNESMLLASRKVFNTIGYYDTNRVGCDTEYKKRLRLAIPQMEITKVDQILVDAFTHDSNLTKQIPLGGPQRRAYVASFTRIHESMKRANNFYKEFKKI